ncbi:MAG: hypothetical protein J0L99_04870 [Chitinophagales bacterium]|nr:hypothetical protein [Chitinophagales bacterium]
MSLAIYYRATDSKELVRSIKEIPEVLIQKVESILLEGAEEQEFRQESAALRSMVLGLEQTPQQKLWLGNVFIGLCQAYSVPLPYGGYYYLELHTEGIEDCMKEDFGLEDFTFSEYFFGRYNQFSPLDLPNYGGFPIVGFIPSEALKELAGRMAHIAISDDDLWELKRDMDNYRAECYAYIRGIKQDFTFCAEQGLDLFSFCH